MEAHASRAHHQLPTAGNALTGVAVSATLHCLTGCAIGEIAGMAIGSALGFSNLASIALAIALAFVFGYALTSLPLLRAGLAFAAVVPIALASDTLSIATMEVIDNAILLLVPGAMEAHLSDLLFWGSLSFALAVAFVVTVPVNRWLLARGKGHAAVHATGVHGGPPIRLVGAVVIAAAVFGTVVVADRALGGEEEMGHVGGGEPTAHGEGGAMASAGALPGVAVAADGLELELDRTSLPAGAKTTLGFEIVGADGLAVTDFDLEQERRMHLIIVRRDLTGFQHLHPTIDGAGRWSTALRVPRPGSYRVFADFSHEGTNSTLGAALAVDGAADDRALPPPRSEATTASGYRVGLSDAAVAGSESELEFEVSRGGAPVEVEPYLGADGHLVALREGDLAYLHVHPIETADGGADGRIRFATEFPSARRYRLFLQFKDRGEVHTAAFTRRVGA